MNAKPKNSKTTLNCSLACFIDPMTAELITSPSNCRTCGAVLTLEEMHYYDHGDGTCTCEACEGRWMENVDRWQRGEIPDFPQP